MKIVRNCKKRSDDNLSIASMSFIMNLFLFNLINFVYSLILNLFILIKFSFLSNIKFFFRDDGLDEVILN